METLSTRLMAPTPHERLRNARLYAGKQQLEVAVHLGVSRTKYLSWEKDSAILLKAESGEVAKVCGFLGVTTDFVLRGEGDLIDNAMELETRHTLMRRAYVALRRLELSRPATDEATAAELFPSLYESLLSEESQRRLDRAGTVTALAAAEAQEGR